jgi:hypothetical protein
MPSSMLSLRYVGAASVCESDGGGASGGVDKGQVSNLAYSMTQH